MVMHSCSVGDHAVYEREKHLLSKALEAGPLIQVDGLVLLLGLQEANEGRQVRLAGGHGYAEHLHRRLYV